MESERYTITFQIQRTDAPDLSDEEAAELEEAHLCHLADLAEEGHLLATGAVPDDVVRGLSIFNVDPHRACELVQADPAVRAGLYTVWAVRWIAPTRASSFSPAPLTRPIAEAGVR